MNVDKTISIIKRHFRFDLYFIMYDQCYMLKNILVSGICLRLTIGINHGFQCSNIRWITMKAFEHKAAGLVFKRLPSDPSNV